MSTTDNVIAWKGIFSSLWKTFRTKFQPILDSLRRHRALLLDERMTACIKEVQESRDKITANFLVLESTADQRLDRLSNEIAAVYQKLSGQLYENDRISQERWSKKQQENMLAIRSSIGQRLDAPDYETDHVHAASKRLGGTGDGVLKDKRFQDWINGRCGKTQTLVMHGKPGAGKFQIWHELVVCTLIESEQENRSWPHT